MKSIGYRLAVLLLLCAVFLCACQTGGGEQETEEQQKASVIMPKQDYEEAPYVDYRLSGLPEFVEDLPQCVDTQRQYVLPDGYMYTYGKMLVPVAVNQLAAATDKDGSVYQECGYLGNARIRSTLEIGESDFSFITGFIPVKRGDVLHFSGNCFLPQHEKAHVMYTVFYDADKKPLANVNMRDASNGFFVLLETNEEGYVTSLQLSGEQIPWDLAYVQLTLAGSGVQQIISVNETLDEVVESFGWKQTEEYIASGWIDEIHDTVQTVNNIELENPESSVRFIFASDIHVDPDPSASYTNSLGKVCAEVMEACGIPFFVTGGDNCTQSSGYMPTVFEENMKVVLDQLAPIPQRNILLSVGNHDGATGSCEENGETVYYRYQLSNEQRSAVFFDWQRQTNEYKRFDSDGTYYYLDDSATKTRYIILNSFWSQWEGEEDGFVPDIQHSFGHTPLFGSQQLTWFAEKALDMPPDYGAVIIVHFAPDAKDFTVFKGIVDAFSTRTTYQGSYAGEEDWQSTEIAVNYKYADGEIIAVFQGHNHEDALHDFFQTVPCINITTAGAHWAVRGEDAVDRVKGTALEFAADVVVVDRTNRIIYLTRLGAGNDRVIKY